MNVEPGSLELRGEYIYGDPVPVVIDVLHADPVIWIGEEALASIRSGGYGSRHASITGDLVTITARNRMLVYRIGRYDTNRRAYLCNWPD